MNPAKRPTTSTLDDVSFPPFTTTGKIKIGINGFGRLGRSVARVAIQRDDIELVAVNDPRLTARQMVYMFRTDNFKPLGEDDDISFKDIDTFALGGKPVTVFAHTEPEEIPWDKAGAEYIVESTGNFTDKDKAAAHLKGGAKKVIITACSEDAPMFIMGVNEHEYKPELDIISTTDYTINCIAPLAKVIQERFGIVKMLMTRCDSIDIVTGFDVPPNRESRRFKTAIPSSNGVAKALGKVIPSLDGKLMEKAVPRTTVGVSYVDLYVNLDKATTHNQITTAIKEESEGKLKGLSHYCEDVLTKDALTKHLIYDSS